MDNIKLSVVIPSWKDPYLIPTIHSLLDNSELGDGLEIIPVFDGYWPEFELVEDPHVHYIHLGKNRGMRGAINAGMMVARGEFVMRLDEHCSFGKGYDRIMTEDCKPNWMMTAPQYYLDPIKWEVIKDKKPNLCQKLVIQGGKKFSGMRWPDRDEKYKDRDLVESMAMQGSMWITPRKWFWDVIGPLETEGYGPAYQDSHEAVFKTWKNGGRLILNKKTWYAHKHRSFSRTHQEGTKENPWVRDQSWAYALKVWREYYEKDIKKRFKL